MTDTREALAEAFLPYAQSDNQSYEMADLAIETIITRILPLVWGQSYWLDGSRVIPAGFYEVRNENSGCYVYFAREKILGFNACWDEDDAKAAANAHHVAQLCKGMGIE